MDEIPERELPASVVSSPYYEQATQAVPRELWMASLTLYQSAARFVTPVTNPGEYKVRFGKKVYSFPDTEMNRGIVALKEFLRDDQQDLFPSIVARIMALGEVLQPMRQQERFSVFFLADATDGSWTVSDALLEAFASAPFVPRTFSVHLEAVYRIATETLAAEKS